MPKYKMRLSNIKREEIQKFSGIYRAPNLNKALLREATTEVLAAIEPVGKWEIFDYDPKQGHILCNPTIILDGKKVPHRLCQCSKVIVVALSLGEVVEKRISQRFLDGEFTLSVAMEGAAVTALNQLFSVLEGQIDKILNKEQLCRVGRYIPGYGDSNTEIAGDLLNLVQGNSIGMRIETDGVLFPRKSMVAIIGVYDKKNKPAKERVMSLACGKCPEDECNFREQEYNQDSDIATAIKKYTDSNEKFTIGDLVRKKESKKIAEADDEET